MDPGAVPGSSTLYLLKDFLVREVFFVFNGLNALKIKTNKNDRLRGTIVFVEFCGNFYFWSVYNLFIQDYPYNMT